MNEALRSLPAVDSLLNAADSLIAAYGRQATIAALRITLDTVREQIVNGEAPATDIERPQNQALRDLHQDN